MDAMHEPGEWILIRTGGGQYNHPNHYEWLISSDACFIDGSEPEDSGAPGSIAYTPDMEKRWTKDAYSEWIPSTSKTGGLMIVDGKLCVAVERS